MENPNSNQADAELETRPDVQFEPQPEPVLPQEAGAGSYVNERIRHAYDRVRSKSRDARDYYRRTPLLQKVIYQGKFMPAFWTVAAVFSLLVNIILIAVLISLGHRFFEFKALVGDGLMNGLSDNLALMDQAHIVKTVPVETTVRLQDNLPVVFDLPINQSTQLSLAQKTRIPNATIYLNDTAVLTDLDLPAGTPLQANINITIPVSQSVPVDITVPVSMLVSLDLPVEETDLHQSIVGLQDSIEPYRVFMSSTFTSPDDISACKPWWSGWLCDIFFGKP